MEKKKVVRRGLRYRREFSHNRGCNVLCNDMASVAKKRKEKREREKKTNTTRREWNGKRKMNRGWNPVRIFSGPFQKETKEFFPSASFQAAIREDDIRNDPRVMRPHRSAPPSPPLSSPRPNVTLSFDRSLNYFLVVI